jgi:general secretion pathway protein K
MLAVLMAILLCAVLVKEFSTNTTIDAYNAGHARDGVRAHFLARSAVNLAHLLIRVQMDVLDPHAKELGDIQIVDYAGMLMGPFGGGKEERAALGELVGGLNEAKGLGLPEGQTFDVEITTEDDRINVNCANAGQTGQETLKARLDALYFLPAFDPIFQTQDADGWQRDRETQSMAIIDYIDRDRAKYGVPGAPEDYGYENLHDRYNAKNNYLDSVGEMRQIRGVDDRFWTLFGNNFTVYGDCKTNLGAVTDPKLLASIIYLSAVENDPIRNDLAKLWVLARKVAEAKVIGIYFSDTAEFVEFVKDPDAQLREYYQSTGQPLPPEMAEKVGAELDKKKLDQIATVGARRTYRVIATGTVDRGVSGVTHRRITAVWDKIPTNQNARDPQNYGKGSWVFWREE